MNLSSKKHSQQPRQHLITLPVASLFMLLILAAIGVFNSGIALLLGLIWAAITSRAHTNPPLPLSSWGSLLLKTAIVLLGFSLPFSELTQQAQTFFIPTVTLIITTLGLAFLMAHLLKLSNHSAWLIGAGTAICGGSAIAAVGSSLKAPNHLMVSSLIIVFLLNAIALWIFPWIGHYFELSQQQFGVWAALAIHDTSSVVGAASDYSEWFATHEATSAIDVATTNKLARALWIIPLSLVAAFSQRNSSSISIPLFILFFLLASSLGSFLPIEPLAPYIATASKQLFAVSLLLLGASMKWTQLKTIDPKSFIMAGILWVIVASASLYWVIHWVN